MQKCGIHAYCGPEVEHEDTLLIKTTVQTCQHSYQIPCVKGFPVCFNATEICIFRLSNYGILSPCRNGEHLQNCRRFECNLKFKCPQSYCIPWSYVCDAKWDCQDGADESMTCINQTRCVSMYMCHKYPTLCITLQNVCDGYKECPKGDDELFCALQGNFYPLHCKCLLFAVHCINGAMPENIHLYISIHFVGVVIIDLDYFVTLCSNIVYLQLSNSKLTNPCYVNYPENVQTLNFGHNNFQVIKRFCFVNQTNLQVLMIHQNQISHLYSHSFHNIYKLNVLNISNNPLNNFPANLFYHPHSLKLLSLTDNQLF